MKNDHYLKPDQQELARAREQIQVELDWIKKSRLPHFKDYKQIQKNIQSTDSSLVKIDESTINFKDTLPIMRYRNPDNRENLSTAYPPYLHIKAHKVLLQIAAEWRIAADKLGVSSEISLALTTLLKTINHKKEIIAAGAYAFLDGPHSTGLAFDFDACGYYLNGISVRPDRPNESAAIQALSANDESRPNKLHYSNYNPLVHSELKKILIRFQDKNIIHFIHENEHNPNNSAFHICVNPLI